MPSATFKTGIDLANSNFQHSWCNVLLCVWGFLKCILMNLWCSVFQMSMHEIEMPFICLRLSEWDTVLYCRCQSRRLRWCYVLFCVWGFLNETLFTFSFRCRSRRSRWCYVLFCVWGFLNETLFIFYFRCRSRRLKWCWTRAWSCSASCRRRTCLSATTNSTWPAGCCSTRAAQTTRRKTWYPSSR